MAEADPERADGEAEPPPPASAVPTIPGHWPVLPPRPTPLLRDIIEAFVVAIILALVIKAFATDA